MKTLSINDLILTHIPLGKVSNSGFYQVNCACCHDYKPRGGWKLSDNQVFYSCFNCGIQAGYTDGDKLSKKFQSVLKSFGISDQEINLVRSNNFFNKNANQESSISIESITKINTFTPEVNLPDKCFRLGDSNIPPLYNELARIYLKSRGLNEDQYPFYLSNEKKYQQRLIIPYYKHNKIIYWQARSMNDSDKNRYINCEVPKSAVLFNIDELFKYSDKPLFVCEGVFDAIHLNGIGLLGSKLNEAKLEILKNSRRPLIFVIDKDNNGSDLGSKVLEEKLGSITFAPGKDDVDKSIVKNGKIWTVYSLLQNASNDDKIVKLKLKSIRSNMNGRKL